MSRNCYSLLGIRNVIAFFSLPPPAMVYTSSLLVIPLLAIAYLLLVYGVLLLAKRARESRRSEG